MITLTIYIDINFFLIQKIKHFNSRIICHQTLKKMTCNRNHSLLSKAALHTVIDIRNFFGLPYLLFSNILPSIMLVRNSLSEKITDELHSPLYSLHKFSTFTYFIHFQIWLLLDPVCLYYPPPTQRDNISPFSSRNNYVYIFTAHCSKKIWSCKQ